jgi:hypothetical protein
VTEHETAAVAFAAAHKKWLDSQAPLRSFNERIEAWKHMPTFQWGGATLEWTPETAAPFRVQLQAKIDAAAVELEKAAADLAAFDG